MNLCRLILASFVITVATSVLPANGDVVIYPGESADVHVKSPVPDTVDAVMDLKRQLVVQLVDLLCL